MVEGDAADVSALERELVTLVRRCFESPTTLLPDDLLGLRALVGKDAPSYVLVLGAFHYVNRIADLLHVDSEMLPEPLIRFSSLRRAGVFFASKLFSRMDLRNRKYAYSFEEACQKIGPHYLAATGRKPDADLESLRHTPWLVEVLQRSLEERENRSLLTYDDFVRVYEGVEAALPEGSEEAEGFHARPAGAVGAFVFVGTRYAARTTRGMVAALRDEGYSDLKILDLAHAVAEANQWARVHRLLGLPRDILAPPVRS